MALAILAVERLRPHEPRRRGHRERARPACSRSGCPTSAGARPAALVVGALSVIFVGYSESLAAARAMAQKHGYEIDPNQELIAQGMANGASGLVGGFVVDGSLSKTSVADAAGQRSQMASLINAVFILLTILLLASLFEKLPERDAGRGRHRRDDRAHHLRPAQALLPRQPRRLGLLHGRRARDPLLRDHPGHPHRRRALAAAADRALLPHLGPPARLRPATPPAITPPSGPTGSRPTPGVLIARVDGPLFFADADRFRTRIQELAGRTARRTEVVIDADAVHLTDTDGADILIQVAHELRSQGAALALAQVHPPVLALWRRAGLIDVDRRGRRLRRPCATPISNVIIAIPRTTTSGISAIRTAAPTVSSLSAAAGRR